MKVLVIGHGIAGVMLAHALRRAGAQATLAGVALPGQSSEAAAGIINPVTGKRFVKSWRVDEFFPAAQEHYRELEALLAIKVWEDRPIIRLLERPEEINNWSARCALPDYSAYLSENTNAGAWGPLLRPGYQIGHIRRAARVNFPALIRAFCDKMASEGCLTPEKVAYDSVEGYLRQFDRLVFCEGFRAWENPYFPGLPWQPAKGEALLLRFKNRPTFHIQPMLKKSSLLAPVGGGLFWIGGAYQWQFDHFLPTPAERAYILEQLDEMVEEPVEVVNHLAGVRPTVKDRRPLIGESPVCKNVYIFNGLGAKGALLAPYWAQHLAQHLMEGHPIDPEVRLQR